MPCTHNPPHDPLHHRTPAAVPRTAPCTSRRAAHIRPHALPCSATDAATCTCHPTRSPSCTLHTPRMRHPTTHALAASARLTCTTHAGLHARPPCPATHAASCCERPPHRSHPPLCTPHTPRTRTQRRSILLRAPGTPLTPAAARGRICHACRPPLCTPHTPRTRTQRCTQTQHPAASALTPAAAMHAAPTHAAHATPRDACPRCERRPTRTLHTTHAVPYACPPGPATHAASCCERPPHRSHPPSCTPHTPCTRMQRPAASARHTAHTHRRAQPHTPRMPHPRMVHTPLTRYPATHALPHHGRSLCPPATPLTPAGASHCVVYIIPAARTSLHNSQPHGAHGPHMPRRARQAHRVTRPTTLHQPHAHARCTPHVA
ncbi:hypothetical protein GGX14DRAFT_580980 [Mycena pura]|uniref:Uncharacterized protein n=1 Tax=Mycena pura TaxID=153505 RepID=A0AAD6XX65_9AGAR|nr:hypothetical protein GGX14DRAFT_580980 [Mycena pura]